MINIYCIELHDLTKTLIIYNINISLSYLQCTEGIPLRNC